jgi:DNA-binding CsgD family transcriptional regulator
LITPARYTELLGLAGQLCRSAEAGVDLGTIAELLRTSLELPICVFSEVDFAKGLTIGYGWPETVFTDDLMTEATTRNARGHPLVRHYVLSGDLTPLEITDTVSMRQWRSSREGSDLYETVGVLHHLAVPLTAPAGAMRSFALSRGRERFTAQDRAFVERLHPLLVALDEQHRSAVPSHLTPRERDVLGLLRRGLSRRAMARRLGISQRTVDKHLENVYRKLSVPDRMAAVRFRARAAHSVGPGTLEA